MQHEILSILQADPQAKELLDFIFNDPAELSEVLRKLYLHHDHDGQPLTTQQAQNLDQLRSLFKRAEALLR